MKKFIEEHFALFLFIAATTAYFYPALFLPVKNFGDEIMMLALFLGFLKLDFSEIRHLKANKIKLLGLIILYLLGLPLIFYVLTPALPEDIRMGLFLLTAMSSAIMCPLLAIFYRLQPLWATAFTVGTSFLVPLTVPLLIQWGFNLTTKIEFGLMFGFLSKIIFIPALAAYGFRRWAPKATKRITTVSNLLGVGCMFVFMGLLIAKNQPHIAEHLFSWFALQALVGLFITTFTLFAIGYMIPAKKTKERLTTSLTFGNMNNGLAILLAAEFFSPGVLLVVLLSEISWISAQPIFAHFTYNRIKENLAE